MKTVRVLVVDDTIVYRKIVGDVLAEIPGVEVVGSASNGKIALSRIATLKPDLITLDIEMPVMSGIEALTAIKERSPEIEAVMLSTLTHSGSDMTIRALELGAFDFIPKPDSGTMAENKLAIKKILTPIILTFQKRMRFKVGLKTRLPLKTLQRPAKPAISAIKRPLAGSRTPGTKSEIIAIGISTGGPNALAKMMPSIPADIGVPIVIVQHMPPMFTQSLAKSLNAKCAIEVKEAEDGEIIKANTAYIAPGGKQMKITAGADGRNRIVKITDDPPENSCRPSADYLFRSVAHHYVGRSTGVIMTGMGSDGTLGLKLMKRNGATVIAQDEASCTVFGMPKEPIESGIADVIAPLGSIASEITKTIKKPGSRV